MSYLYIPLFGFFWLTFLNFLIFFQSGPTFNRPLRIVEYKNKEGINRYRVQQRDWLGIWITCFMPDHYGLIPVEFESIEKADNYIQAELKFRKILKNSKIVSKREVGRYH